MRRERVLIPLPEVVVSPLPQYWFLVLQDQGRYLSRGVIFIHVVSPMTDLEKTLSHYPYSHDPKDCVFLRPTTRSTVLPTPVKGSQ